MLAQPSLITMLQITSFHSWLTTQCTLTSGLQQLPVENGRLHMNCHAAHSHQSSNCIDLSPNVSCKYRNPSANNWHQKGSITYELSQADLSVFTVHILPHTQLCWIHNTRANRTDWYTASTSLLMTMTALLASNRRLHLSYQHHQKSMLVIMVLQLRRRMTSVTMNNPLHRRTLSTVS